MADTLEQLQGVVRAVFGDPDVVIGPATTAADVAGWDSLSHVRLIMAIEDAFGVRLDPVEASEPRNVGELLELIASKAET